MLMVTTGLAAVYLSHAEWTWGGLTAGASIIEYVVLWRVLAWLPR